MTLRKKCLGLNNKELKNFTNSDPELYELVHQRSDCQTAQVFEKMFVKHLEPYPGSILDIG